MKPEPDNVCFCYRVPLHKIVKYCRLHRPKVASQLSECYGAGTGCGWCIPFLERIFEEMKDNPDAEPKIGMSGDEYRERRKAYLEKINAEKMRDEREE